MENQLTERHFIKKEDDETIKPKQYKKNPVVVEAMRLVGGAIETHPVVNWLADNRYPMLVGDYTEPETLRYPDQDEKDFSRPDKGVYIDPASGDLIIRTLEGDMRARYGVYIIKGIRGEFYPCAAAIFNRTYSLFEED